MANSPEFLACGRVVGNGLHGAGADKLPAAIKINNGARGISFLAIAVIRSVVNIPVTFLDGFSRALVHCHHELEIIPVVGHDQVVVVDNRGGAGSAPVITWKVTTGPENLA